MFLAGLLEADNAAAVAAMTVTPGSIVTFSVPSIRPHMDQVKDIGRATPDPEFTKELKAAYDEYFDNFNPHMRAARDAAIKQIHKLAGPAWRKQADAVIALSTLWAGETLVAMIAAASMKPQECSTFVAVRPAEVTKPARLAGVDRFNIALCAFRMSRACEGRARSCGAVSSASIACISHIPEWPCMCAVTSLADAAVSAVTTSLHL